MNSVRPIFAVVAVCLALLAGAASVVAAQDTRQDTTKSAVTPPGNKPASLATKQPVEKNEIGTVTEVKPKQVAKPKPDTPVVAKPVVAKPAKAVAPVIINKPAKVAAPKAAAPKVAAPKVAAPKVAAPKVAAPKVATPKVVAPKVAAPMVITPKSVAKIQKPTKPAVVKPVVAPAPKMVAKPSDDKPAGSKSVVAKPKAEKSIVAKPVVAKPVAAKSIVAKPAVAKPAKAMSKQKPQVKKPARKVAKPKTKQPPKPVAAMPKPATTPSVITVASWGGGYTWAQDRAIFDPFTKRTGIAIYQVHHAGAGRELESRSDVVDLSATTLSEKCRSGELIPLEDINLSPPGATNAASGDLIAGARTKCGIASTAWSRILLVRAGAFKKGRVPKTLKDVFDTRRYPGKRAFVKSPRYLLEMALMADGVVPADVYATLSSPEGLDRAFAKLEPLRAHIVWLDSPGGAYEMLTSGKVAIAAAFSGRAFRLTATDPDIKAIWDGQIYDVDYWAIPKSSRNKKRARRFVRFATAPNQLAANARHFPYGPMRRSAVQMTGKHEVLGIDLMPYLPTSPMNLTRALRVDHGWWATHEPSLNNLTEEWLSNPVEPQKKRRGRKKANR